MKSLFLNSHRRICFFSFFFLFCGSYSVFAQEKRYEILTQQEDGGGPIRFYEIVSEAKEIAMLENDPHLKNKIKVEDITTANFVILNMGEKKAKGYSIAVQNIEETTSQIIITVVDKIPKQEIRSEDESYYPYTILKINSKKELLIK